MSDLREAAVTFLAIVVAMAIVVLALFAVGACTLHVIVRTEPVARVAADAAVAVTPPASPGLVGDAGPCGIAPSSLSVRGTTTAPCTMGVYSPDASLTRQANCENAGDVFEDCQK